MNLSQKMKVRSDFLSSKSMHQANCDQLRFMIALRKRIFSANYPLSKYIPEYKDIMVAKDVKRRAPAGRIGTYKIPIPLCISWWVIPRIFYGLGTNWVDKEVVKGFFTTPASSFYRIQSKNAMPNCLCMGQAWSTVRIISCRAGILAPLMKCFRNDRCGIFYKKRTFRSAGNCQHGYNLTKNKTGRMANLCIVIMREGKLIKAPRPNSVHSVIKFLQAQMPYLVQSSGITLDFAQNDGPQWWRIRCKQYLSPKTIADHDYGQNRRNL